MKLRSCTLEYADNKQDVLLTLLSGDECAVTVKLPPNPDNPFYEPKDTTLLALAIDQEAEELIATQPQHHSRLGVLEGSGAITTEYEAEVERIKQQEIDKKQKASKGQIDERIRKP